MQRSILSDLGQYTRTLSLLLFLPVALSLSFSLSFLVLMNTLSLGGTCDEAVSRICNMTSAVPTLQFISSQLRLGSIGSDKKIYE